MVELLALTVIATVLLLVLTGAAALALADWARAARTGLRRRMLVNLHGGNAIDGVLWSRRGALLVLRDARLLEPGAEAVQLDGDVLVDRREVSFSQVPKARS